LIEELEDDIDFKLYLCLNCENTFIVEKKKEPLIAIGRVGVALFDMPAPPVFPVSIVEFARVQQDQEKKAKKKLRKLSGFNKKRVRGKVGKSWGYR
jgi:hypothetical protein